jgi:hypothetical protein
VVRSSTFTGALVRRLGVANFFGDQPDRYPHADLVALQEVRLDFVLLRDEPYEFTTARGVPRVGDPCGSEEDS